MIDVSRDARLRGEIVRSAERNDSERRIEAIEAIHDFIDSAVTAQRDDDIGAGARRRGSHGRPIPRFERYPGLHEMTLPTHPVDQMAHVLALGAGAMNDHREMLPAAADHRDSSTLGGRGLPGSTRQRTQGLARRGRGG